MRRIFTIILLAASLIATAQKPGTLDKTFGKQGKVVDSSRGYYSSGQNGLILPSDKYLVINSFEGDAYRGIITRYLPDGRVDSTFATNGKYIDNTPIAGNFNIKLLRQNSGKIIRVSGSLITRLFADGRIDSSFGINGVCSIKDTIPKEYETPHDAVLQPDGKIVMIGTWEPIGTFTKAYVRRYTADGKTDVAFGDSGRVILRDNTNLHHLDGKSVVSLADGSIVAGMSINGGNSYFFLEKLQPDGKPDSTFGTFGKLRSETIGTERLESIALDAAGNIIASGTGGKGSIGGIITRRYNNFGKGDKSFGSNGVSVVQFDTLICYGGPILIQKDGKIIIRNTAGYHSTVSSISYYFSMVRLLTNGRVDSTFGKYGKTIVVAPDTHSTFLGLQSTGKILFAGSIYNKSQSAYSAVQLRFNNNDNAASVVTANTPNNILINNLTISISPNPARDIIRISGLPANEKANISVVERNGNILLTAVASSSSYSLNIDRLHSGLYNLVVTVKGKTQTLQFLKE